MVERVEEEPIGAARLRTEVRPEPKEYCSSTTDRHIDDRRLARNMLWPENPTAEERAAEWVARHDFRLLTLARRRAEVERGAV